MARCGCYTHSHIATNLPEIERRGVLQGREAPSSCLLPMTSSRRPSTALPTGTSTGPPVVRTVIPRAQARLWTETIQRAAWLNPDGCGPRELKDLVDPIQRAMPNRRVLNYLLLQRRHPLPRL